MADTTFSGGRGALALRGTDELQAALAALGPRALQAAAAALFREGEAIMAVSKGLVPLDTGTLMNSGHVELPEIQGETVVVTLAYGGPAEAYAVVQHERLDFIHPNGRQAKYLEQPVLQAAAGLEARLAEQLRAPLEQGA